MTEKTKEIIKKEIEWTDAKLSEKDHPLTKVEKATLAFHKMRLEAMVMEVEDDRSDT